MRYRIYIFFVLFFLNQMFISGCRKVNGLSEPEGPFFLQTHYTNRILKISSEQLKGILRGKYNNFKQLGGQNRKINLYVDERISRIIKENYPKLKFITIKFGFNKILTSKRSFLGISDVRGVFPFFKVLYINNLLPWGKINPDYTITPDDTYPFMLQGIPKWNNELSLSVVNTGVTAMTRAFVPAVKRSKDLYSPVKFTANITSQADIAVTSNEVSFLDPCSYPLKNNLIFCSPLKFFKILERSGFDVIELTGNHNNDFGSKYNRSTMKMIEDNGMSYFGAGKNKNEAESVKYLSVKNIKLAFIGFNEAGPPMAWATDKKTGAAKLSKSIFKKLVKEALKKADIIFLSLQSANENSPRPWENQKKYFRLAAEMGVTIIISSSAHRVMGLEFYKGRFISYGLGNFLFDQMHTKNHRRGLIARHFFYAGKHIQTELIPYMIYNYSQPRLLNGSRADNLFKDVFKYSLGTVFR